MILRAVFSPMPGMLVRISRSRLGASLAISCKASLALFFSAQNVVNSHFEATNMSTVLFDSWACDFSQPNKTLRYVVSAFFTNTG